MEIPAPIAAYLAADKSRDRDALLACFTDDAVVHDEGGEYRGLSAISTWRDEVEAKYRYEVEPLSMAALGNHYIKLHVRLSGDFPGSPVEPDFTFRLTEGKIASLTIE